MQHVEGNPNTGFRGATEVISDPITGSGAAYWADEGGWVYQIRGVPAWDANALLQGRVRTPGGFRGNLMAGENEFVIPAQISPQNIVRYGQVQADQRGRLFVQNWIENPNFNPAGRK